MQRIWLITAVFFCVSLTGVSAEIYKCRTPDGNLVVTDQEANLPRGCQKIEGSSTGSTFNIVPETKAIDVESPSTEAPKISPESSADSLPDPSQAVVDQAKTLVQDYKEAVRKRYHSSFVADQRRAIQQIESLRKEKQQILSGLTGSGLSRNEQAKVRNILNEIPQQ